jgi:hypothetical protein
MKQECELADALAPGRPILVIIRAAVSRVLNRTAPPVIRPGVELKVGILEDLHFRRSALRPAASCAHLSRWADALLDAQLGRESQ